jgi:flagellar motility protein MotE (MotC chaperone)
MKWQRFAINPKIVSILGAIAVVAVLKLTVLGALGLNLWEQLRGEELLPLSKAMAAQAGKQTPAPAAAPAASGPAEVAPAAEAAPADPDMLAANAVPQANVGESTETKSANRREAELAARERALAAMEKSVDDKLAQLKQVEASIKKLLDQADVLKDARIKRQVETYQAMKPKQAAEVLSNMDQELAVKILTGMKPKVAGEIMTYVKTDKAAKLTEAMTKVQAAMQGPGQ